MTIDSIMNNSRTAEPGIVVGRAVQPTLGCANGVDWSLGSVSGRAGLHKGVFQERDRPSQMKHTELKNRLFLFRVSFSPFRFDQAGYHSRDASLCLSVCLDDTTKSCNRSHVAPGGRCL